MKTTKQTTLPLCLSFTATFMQCEQNKSIKSQETAAKNKENANSKAYLHSGI